MLAVSACVASMSFHGFAPLPAVISARLVTELLYFRNCKLGVWQGMSHRKGRSRLAVANCVRSCLHLCAGHYCKDIIGCRLNTQLSEQLK